MALFCTYIIRLTLFNMIKLRLFMLIVGYFVCFVYYWKHKKRGIYTYLRTNYGEHYG